MFEVVVPTLNDSTRAAISPDLGVIQNSIAQGSRKLDMFCLAGAIEEHMLWTNLSVGRKWRFAFVAGFSNVIVIIEMGSVTHCW